MSANYKKVIISILNLLIENKKLKRYAFFFLIAFSFWFLTMLSKMHETTYLIPISYVNYPVDLLNLVPPPDFVRVRVKSSGISILSFQLFNRSSLVLNYDASNSQPTSNGKNVFWIMNSKRKELTDFLGSSTEIMNINPERIFIPFANRINKEVPLVLNSEINLKQAFWLANNIKLTPQSVTIYGEQELLDSVHVVSTDLLKLDNLDMDQEHDISLVIPDGLDCNHKTVLVEIDVEAFIEEIISQQVEIRNLDKGCSMKLFPRDVSVTLRFPQDKFQLLKTNLLRLYVDASEVSLGEVLHVQYDDLPEGVKVVRLFPENLEFLLIKE